MYHNVRIRIGVCHDLEADLYPNFLEIYRWHPSRKHELKMTPQAQTPKNSITNTRSTFSWRSGPSCFTISLWWNSRLLCHSQFAFLMTEAETARDKKCDGESATGWRATWSWFYERWERAAWAVNACVECRSGTVHVIEVERLSI